MPSTTHTRTKNLDPRIVAPLDALRRRVRRYVWLHGLGTTIAAVGTIFWLSLLIDWFFEPGVVFRAILLLAAFGTIATVAFNLLIRRLRTPMSDANMALLLERRFPQLNDTLLTTVLLDADHTEGLRDEMLARTTREATRRLGDTRLADVFNPVPLRRAVVAALLLTVLIGWFSSFSPDSMKLWARRTFFFSPDLWPRRTELTIDGFENGTCKVARGASLEIVAKANTKKPLIPKTVEIRYRTDSGTRGRAAMNRDGEAAPGRDPFQRYTHTFQGILSPITFDLVGGDARIDDLRIEVVESPKIDSLELWCEYPDYMARAPRSVSVVGPMEIPRNARIRIDGRSNKSLIDVRIDQATSDGPAQSTVLEPADNKSNRREFSHAIGTLQDNVTLLITLRDADGIESAEPTRLVILAVDDEPPSLEVALSGIGTAITPKARLPIVGHVRDDHGIAQVWFDFGVDKAKPSRKTTTTLKGNVTEIAVDDALEVRDLGLVPGQKFHVALKASDRYDLEPEPRVGESQRWQLDVVTPGQLRTILQNRELTLRRRFERIIQEVEETRDALAQISSDKGKKQTEQASGKKSGDSNSDGAEPEDKSKDWAGREPGDKPDEPSKASNTESQQRRFATDSLHCERAVQNSRKNANETLGVAEAFDDLRFQIVNNRIDTEELKIRLKSGVADPLRIVSEEMFPELDRRLVALREVLRDDQLRPIRRKAAQEQVDTILVAMNRVLNRMMELEDFNEALDLLKEIIKAQEKLKDETRRQHRASLLE